MKSPRAAQTKICYSFSGMCHMLTLFNLCFLTAALSTTIGGPGSERRDDGAQRLYREDVSIMNNTNSSLQQFDRNL